MNEKLRKTLKVVGSAAIGIALGVGIANAVVNKNQSAVLENHEVRIANLEQQVADINNTINALEAQKDAEIKDLQDKYGYLNNEINSLKNSLQTQANTIENIITKLNTNDADKEVFQNIVDDIKEQIVCGDNTDEEMTNKINDLVTRLENAISALQEADDTLTAAVTELKTNLKQLADKVTEVETKLTQAIANVKTEYDAKLANIQSQIDALNDVYTVTFKDRDETEPLHLEAVVEGKVAHFYEYSKNDYIKGHFWTSAWTVETVNRGFDAANDVYTTSTGEDTWNFERYVVLEDTTLYAVKNYFMDSNHEYNLPIIYNVTNKTEFDLPAEIKNHDFFVDLGDKSPETTLPATFSRGKTTINSYKYRTSYPGSVDPEFKGVYFTGRDYEEFYFKATGARLVSTSHGINMPIYNFYDNLSRAVWDDSKDKNALVGETYDVVIDGTETIVVDVEATYCHGLFRFCWNNSIHDYGFDDSCANKLMKFGMQRTADSLEIWTSVKHDEQMLDTVSIEVITNEELTVDDIEMFDGNGEVITLAQWHEYGFALIDVDEERDPSESFLTDAKTDELYTRLYDVNICGLDEIAAQDIVIKINKKSSINNFGGMIYIRDYKTPTHFDQQIVIDSVATAKILFNGEDIKVGQKVRLDIKEGDVIKIVLPHQYLLGLVEYCSSLVTAESYDAAKGKLGAKVSGGHDTWTNTEEVTEITVKYNRSYYILVGYASI